MGGSVNLLTSRLFFEMSGSRRRSEKSDEKNKIPVTILSGFLGAGQRPSSLDRLF
jgi:hypothetical protein